MCPQIYTVLPNQAQRAEQTHRGIEGSFHIASAARRCWCAGRARAEAGDLRRVGLMLCAASSLMTLGSAVTAAIYLL